MKRCGLSKGFESLPPFIPNEVVDENGNVVSVLEPQAVEEGVVEEAKHSIKIVNATPMHIHKMHDGNTIYYILFFLATAKREENEEDIVLYTKYSLDELTEEVFSELIEEIEIFVENIPITTMISFTKIIDRLPNYITDLNYTINESGTITVEGIEVKKDSVGVKEVFELSPDVFGVMSAYDSRIIELEQVSNTEIESSAAYGYSPSVKEDEQPVIVVKDININMVLPTKFRNNVVVSMHVFDGFGNCHALISSFQIDGKIDRKKYRGIRVKEVEGIINNRFEECGYHICAFAFRANVNDKKYYCIRGIANGTPEKQHRYFLFDSEVLDKIRMDIFKF